MITEDYISFETAKLLKEKGFDEKVDTLYKMDAEFLKSTLCINYNNPDFELSDMHHIPEKTISAPTLQMAIKWLREEKKLNCIIDVSFNQNRNKGPEYYFCVWENKPPYYLLRESLQTFSTYKEAEEAAIKCCLENLI